MGKQTRKNGSKFGGLWTKEKLYIIEEYLKSYSMALKNKSFRKIYIDAFAGSGKTELKTIVESNEVGIFDFLEDDFESNEYIIDGSAMISLKYDFDEYYFVEIDYERIEKLKKLIRNNYPNKLDKVHFINEDANKHINTILKKLGKYDKCVMFLDPFSLELKWEVLEKISQYNGIDLWYLFPLSINRLIPRDKSKLDDRNKEIVTSILGTDTWEKELYKVHNVYNLFGDEEKEVRVEISDIIKYIENRFKIIFKYVNNNSVILKNDRNSPLFMLSFMMTNPNDKAIKLADKLVKAIVKGAVKKYAKS